MAIAAPGGDQVMSELNTTPLIDVMLVLLIMFIITIPVQTHSVPIDLPAGDVVIENDRNKLIVDREGALFWNGSALTTEALAATLQRVAAMPRQPELQLEPHAEARYARVDEILALIKRANINAMGMVGNERYARF
jgi:biopolymer transport protein ExbD